MGLVQREIEAAGVTTITLSNVPEMTAAVSAPRIAGIEHPFGRILGAPGDYHGQMSVLRSTLDALVEMQTPGEVRHLPFEWNAPPESKTGKELSPPPIAGHLMKHPWDLPRLRYRRPPE